jgi:hypothetical protein
VDARADLKLHKCGEARLVDLALGGERCLQHWADSGDDRRSHQNADRAGLSPLEPTRKSRSTPRSACRTWSTYSGVHPRSDGRADGVQADQCERSSSSSTRTSSPQHRDAVHHLVELSEPVAYHDHGDTLVA